MIRGGGTYRQNRTFKERIHQRDKGTCQECGGVLGDPGINQMDVAHIIPYSECYETLPGNVRLLCHSCNQRERDPSINAALPLDEWWGHIERELASCTVVRMQGCVPV